MSSVRSSAVSGEWELRAAAGRAVLSGGSPTQLSAELRSSLTEWAQVAQAIAPQDGHAGRLVVDRGRRLALRVADTTQVPVRYVDPVHGEEELIAPTLEPEPVPWATGLPIALAAAIVMVVALVALSEGLATVGIGVAVVGNLVIAGGLAPSLWLLKGVRTWRWIGFGVVAGILAAWVGMLAALPA